MLHSGIQSKCCASENGFFIECFIPVFRTNAVLVKTITQIRVKPFFTEQPVSYYWKLFFTSFLDIPAAESSFSVQRKRISLTNPLFWIMGSDFLSIGNNNLLFTNFFLLVETIISSKIRFEKYFSSRRKKTGRCLRKMEKKTMVFTSRKINCPLARISSFSQNCFLFIQIMVSTSSEIALTKKYCFHQAENKLFL